MNDIGTDREAITFSRFTLDPERGLLLDGERHITLRPKAFEVLHYLLRNAGHVVSQRTLLDAVWGDTVVTEDSVRQCIADVRKALGGEAHKIVRTLPRRGYIVDLPPDAEPAPGETSGHPRRRILWLAVASLGILLLAATSSRFLVNGADDAGMPLTPQPPENSIAVLRFTDMSPGGDHGYLAEGVAEEILHRLAQSPSLRVVARTSSFATEGETIASVVEQLNVAHVLEGSIRRTGDRIRVTVQLVDGVTSGHIWSEAYDADFGDILAIQAGIADAVAERLDASLVAGDAGGTDDTRALEHLLQARFLYRRRAPSDLARAESHFRQALDFDPEYAEAWVGLAAVANVRLHDGSAREDDPGRRESLWALREHAVERALRFGPRSADTQMRAASYFWQIGERERALSHLERARELDPDHWLVMAADASALVASRRLDEAIEIVKESTRLDPLNAVTRHNLATSYLMAGRFEAALTEYLKVADLQPVTAGSPDRSLQIAKILILLGRYEEAFDRILSLPEGRLRTYGLALVQHGLLSIADANQALAELEAQARRPEDLLAAAEVRAFRGDSAEALAWLQRLAPLSACQGAAMPHRAYYSPFIARLPRSSELDEWRMDAARRMSECSY